MNILDTLGNLLEQTAFFSLTWGNYLMIVWPACSSICDRQGL